MTQAAKNIVGDPGAAQHRASDPTCSVWVEASAGTGKTKVLTDRVLRLLLNGTAPGRILCLTFTKAAAAEMAERITRRLAQWVAAGDVDLFESLQEFSDVVDEKMMQRARGLFVRVLDVPGGMKIQTIHSFCQSLLKRFPLEAGITPHFDVLDDRSQAEILRQAQEKMFSDMPDLGLVSVYLGQDGFLNLVGELIARRSLFADLGRDFRKDPQHVTKKYYQAFGFDQPVTAEDVWPQAVRVPDEEKLRQAAQYMAEHGTEKTYAPRGMQILNWLMLDAAQRKENWLDYQRAFLTAAELPFAKILDSKAAKNADDMIEILLAEQDRVFQIAQDFKKISLILSSLGLLGVAARLLGYYEDLKKRQALLDFEDLILLSRHLLQRSGMAPWVLFKLDGGIDHVLVDEAQDTSPVQWDVILSLVNGFYEGARSDQDRTLFVVGDGKQSIYSFQGADAIKFRQVRDYVKQKMVQHDLAFAPIDLQVSFRSTPAVLQFVDQVFAHLPARDGVVEDHITLNHAAHRDGDAGRVEIWKEFAPDEKDKKDDVFDVVTDPDYVVSPRAQMAEKIARTVAGWIENKEMLESKERPIRAGDVMVLVRKRGKFMDEMVRCFKKHGVPVAGVDRMVLVEQLPVMDLISLGRFLLLPQDDLSLAEILKSPLCGFGDDDLFDLGYQRAGSLWAALQEKAHQKPHWQAASILLGDLLNQVDFLTPFQLYAKLLDAQGLRKKMVARMGSNIHDALNEFLSLAFLYESRHVPSLEGFLHWMAQGQSEVKRNLEQSGRDEVRVITAHGAKGLQAPIVFLPDMFFTRGGKDKNIFWQDGLMMWSPRKEDDAGVVADLRAEKEQQAAQEYRRLLYVALTRAEDRLYIGGWRDKKEPSTESWYRLIADAMKIDAADAAAGDVIYTHKNSQTAPVKTEKIIETKNADHDLPAWIDQMAAPEQRPGKPLSPSQPMDLGAGVASPLQLAALKRGRLMHRLLEILPDVKSDVRVEKSLQFLRKNGVDENTARGWVDDVMRLLGDDDLAMVFGENSRAEVPVTGIVDGQVISGQIDRLVVTDRHVWIVDYKTNVIPPDDGAVPEIYQKQIHLYRALIQQIYPNKEIKAGLLWTATMQFTVL